MMPANDDSVAVLSTSNQASSPKMLGTIVMEYHGPFVILIIHSHRSNLEGIMGTGLGQVACRNLVSQIEIPSDQIITTVRADTYS
jgi:hypothetical protein